MNPWLLLGAGALAVSATVGAFFYGQSVAETQGELNLSNQRIEWQRESRVAVDAARAEEQRRILAAQEIANETQRALDAARADADAAVDAGQRLRDRIAALTTSCGARPGGAPAGSTGKAANSPGDMLADVQRRLDEATNTIARFADDAHARGKSCEQTHDSVSGR